MENQNYDALETHFNSYDASKLRGLVGENSAIGYAAYVLIGWRLRKAQLCWILDVVTA